jgi:N-acetylneuraminic acid mutarotase
VALVASLLQVFVLQPTIAQLAGRGDHAAVALARGDLLIAGGCSNKPSTGSLAALIRQIRPARSRSGDSGWLDSALVYSPAHNTWSGAGRLTQARCPVQALALPDGEVLVLSEAGTSEQPAVTAERYSPANGAWSAAGKLLIARREFAATLLASGQLLVIGGTSPTGGGDAISSVERYDPKTNNWSLAAGLTQGRRMHTATLLASGQVLVVGGLSSTGPLGTVERYDPRTNAWSPTAPLQQPRAQHTATLLADGHLLVAGGVGSGLSERSRLGTVERYDPSTNVWSRASGLSQARAGHTAGLSPAGEVLVVGGSGQTGDPPTLERFSPENNRWTAGPPLPRPRVSHSTTILPGGQVLVVGGRASASDLSLLNTADMYDPTTDRWRPAADLLP